MLRKPYAAPNGHVYSTRCWESLSNKEFKWKFSLDCKKCLSPQDFSKHLLLQAHWCLPQSNKCSGCYTLGLGLCVIVHLVHKSRDSNNCRAQINKKNNKFLPPYGALIMDVATPQYLKKYQCIIYLYKNMHAYINEKFGVLQLKWQNRAINMRTSHSKIFITKSFPHQNPCVLNRTFYSSTNVRLSE